MKNVLLLLASLLVLWDYESQETDTLEVQFEADGAWVEVPGPYGVTEDQYSVDVTSYMAEHPSALFRVRREWR